MPKEIMPPDPIPIGKDEPSKIDNMYCASYVDYSADSYSETSKTLLTFLEETYASNHLGGSTRSFIAYNTTQDEIINAILSENIPGITMSTIDQYITCYLYPTEVDVVIFVNLY